MNISDHVCGVAQRAEGSRVKSLCGQPAVHLIDVALMMPGAGSGALPNIGVVYLCAEHCERPPVMWPTESSTGTLRRVTIPSKPAP